MWCAARRFDTPSLGFILIPDNPKEMLCGAFTRKHKFEFVCNLTKRMRKKIFKREGRQRLIVGGLFNSPWPLPTTWRGRAKTWERETEAILHTSLAA